MSKNKKQNSEYIIPTLKAYFMLLWKNFPGRTIISLLHTVATIMISVIVPYLISMAFADIITQNTDAFWQHIIALTIVVSLASIFNIVGFTVAIRLAARMEKLATDTAFKHLLSRSVGFHADNPSGKLVANALDYGKNASTVLFDLIFNGVLPYALSSIIGIGIVLFQSTQLGLALLFIYIVTIGYTLFDSRRRSRIRIERKVAQDAATANIADVIINTQATKTFARETFEMHTNDRLQNNLMEFRLRDWSWTAKSGGIRLSSLLFLQILFIIFIANQIQVNPAALGVGIYAFTYTLGMVSKLFELGTIIRTGENALLSASTMTKYLLEEPEINDIKNAGTLHVTKGELSLSKIKFAYPGSENAAVFKNFNLHIDGGAKIGLVGKSGGGKSSLTRLLLRFDDIQAGKILIDGQDIATVAQTSLRESIGYVPQEPLLFHRTLLENIVYGRENASDADIQSAIKKAHAKEFIDKLPQGLETVVGERGVKLSGGQRQRVAIARAILKDAPILILDEATSALDSESEVLIQSALENLMKNRTSIVIAHRLSTIAKLDRIIVLDNGKIIEDGTHTELLGAKGTYAKLWSHQSGGFIEE